MTFDRKILAAKLELPLGLVRTLQTAFEEEPDKLHFKEINDLTDILEDNLKDALEYAKQ